VIARARVTLTGDRRATFYVEGAGVVCATVTSYSAARCIRVPWPGDRGGNCWRRAGWKAKKPRRLLGGAYF
jgi:hypothetical protein